MGKPRLPAQLLMRLRGMAYQVNGFTECGLGEFPNRAAFSVCQHEIVGLLDNLVLAFETLPGVAPIAFGFPIAEAETILELGLARDFADYNGFAADQAFVVQ